MCIYVYICVYVCVCVIFIFIYNMSLLKIKMILVNDIGSWMVNNGWKVSNPKGFDSKMV